MLPEIPGTNFWTPKNPGINVGTKVGFVTSLIPKLPSRLLPHEYAVLSFFKKVVWYHPLLIEVNPVTAVIFVGTILSPTFPIAIWPF